MMKNVLTVFLLLIMVIGLSGMAPAQGTLSGTGSDCEHDCEGGVCSFAADDESTIADQETPLAAPENSGGALPWGGLVILAAAIAILVTFFAKIRPAPTKQ